MLISFTALNHDPYIYDNATHKLVLKVDPTLPDTLGYKDVREVTVLSQKGTTKLYNILFPDSHDLYNMRGCYFPRNAILFRDSNDSTIAIIEVCFECQNAKLWPAEMYDGGVDEIDYYRIKELFAESGIRHGTSER